MWCKCLWLFWLTALSSVMYDMLASPNKRGTFWLIISGFILFRFFDCKERVMWDGEWQWGRKKKRKALFCEQKNRFRIIKAADSYSISVQYTYQVSPRRIRNLSLGIYLIHYELIIDKHLQSDRDILLPQRAHKLNRTKLSPPSGILNMRKEADANQKSLCRSLWQVRFHFLKKQLHGRM